MIAGLGWSFTGPNNDGDGERVAITYEEPPGPWTYHVHGTMVDGRPVITGLSIGQLDPGNPTAITRQALRSAPIGVLQERVRRGLFAKFEDRASEILGLARSIRPKAGRSRTDGHYHQVAWWYLHAQATGKAPRQAICEHWGVSGVTASRWLAEARRRGYLPEYQPARKAEPPTAACYSAINRLVEEQIFLKVLDEWTSDHEEVRRAAEALVDAMRNVSAVHEDTPPTQPPTL